MILDSLARFSDAQSGTTSVAHTDIINALAAGNDYNGCFFVFQVGTAFAQTGTLSRLTVQLQTSDVEGFNDVSDVTLVQSAALATSQLGAGKRYAIQIPPGAKKYLRAYNSVSGTSGSTQIFTAGSWSAFIVKDVDVEINKRYQI